MGFFSRKKKPQEKIIIKGFPGHVDTCKCLYLVSEKDIQIDLALLDSTEPTYQQTLFNKAPCLTDGKLTVSGAAAVLPYLDVKGKGQSLAPKKAARLGEQNYWIEVGQRKVLPHINSLLHEQLLRPIADSGYQPDQQVIDTAVAGLTAAFAIADKYLVDKPYFAGNFSLAEIHWMPYLHFCQLTGQDALMTAHPNVAEWFIHNKARKTSDNKLTFAAMPTIEQIMDKELRYVA